MLVPTAIWMGIPISVKRGIRINPPPTPSNPDRKPVTPPTARASAIHSSVMAILIPGAV
jgi:hypothetical protein